MPASALENISAALNNELQMVSNWVIDNKLVLNIGKTKSILFGTKCSLKTRPRLDLVLNNVAVEQVHEIKLLGVTLDCTLSWSRHIDEVVKKMGRNISVVKRCYSFLNSYLIKPVLQTLVLSHLDYCSVVWSGTTKKNLGKLQRVQNRAARLALCCTTRANVNKMHSKLYWLPVDERLKTSLLGFINKINLWKTPDCLYRQLTLSSNVHTYLTRHAVIGKYIIPKSRTNSKQRTVLYRAMVEWNSLPGHIAKIQNIMGFKKQIKEFFMLTYIGR